MGASASDVRAGGAWYELYARDGLTPALARARAQVQVLGQFLSGFDPGAGGTGFLNRIVFGAKEFDAKTKEYVGRVGGLAAPLRAALGKVGSGLGQVLGRVFDSGAGGTGLINRILYGQKETDQAGQFVGRTGGLIALGQSIALSFRAAAANVRALATGLGQVGAAAGGLGAALAAPLVALVKGGIDRAADTARLSRQYGVDIQTLNKLKYAADAAGVSLDEVAQDRTGRYSDLVAKAPTLDPSDARAAAEAQLALSDATRSLQDALVPLVRVVAPYLRQAAQWVQKNSELVAVLVPVAAGLTLVGAVAGGTALALYALGVAGGAALAVIKGAFAALVSPVGLAAAAIAGLGYLFVRYTDTGREFAARVGESLRGELLPAAERAREVLLGVGGALAKGDLEGAAEVATAGLDALWTGLLARWERSWAQFKGRFLDGWHAITGGLGPILETAWRDVEAFADGVWGAIKDGARNIRDTWDRVSGYLSGPLEKGARLIAPLVAPLVLPFTAAAYLIREAWDNLDDNIVVNLVNLGAWIKRLWIDVGGTVENVLKRTARTAIDTTVAAAEKLKGFDPTGGLAKGIEEANKVKAAIGEDRNLTGEKDAVTAQQKDQIEFLRRQQREAQDKRSADRAADVKAAEDASTAAQKNLSDVLRKDAAPRPNSPEAVLPPIREGLLGTIGVKGTFSSAALGQQLGAGDEVNRQTELLKALVDQNGALPDNIAQKLAPLVGSPRIGR